MRLKAIPNLVAPDCLLDIEIRILATGCQLHNLAIPVGHENNGIAYDECYVFIVGVYGYTDKNKNAVLACDFHVLNIQCRISVDIHPVRGICSSCQLDLRNGNFMVVPVINHQALCHRTNGRKHSIKHYCIS
jgi:hypothetical protein